MCIRDRVAGLLAALAGLFYWAPKIWGRLMPAALGMLAGLLLLGGAVVSAVPDAISGFLDQPDFAAEAGQGSGVEALNLISAIGSVVVAIGVLAAAASVVLAFMRPSDQDDRNPWMAHTLEWLTESPPAPGNFEGPLVVTSEAPLLDDDFENPYAEGASA